MSVQLIVLAEGALTFVVIICFPSLQGSPIYLAKKDLLDVGSLSCQVLFQLVSGSLQVGIRFFQHPTLALS